MAEVKLTAKQALEVLARHIERAARSLSPTNVHDREDIEQEMCLGVLTAGSSGVWPVQYYKKAAHSAAMDWLRKNAKHTRLTVGGVPREVSLDKLIEDGAEL